jgi:hypothetical protein
MQILIHHHFSLTIRPIATKSWRQSPADLNFMREEVLKLQQKGIIRPSVLPWRAQVFFAKEDANHKRRMVVDYSETINLFTEIDAFPMPNVSQMVQEISQYKYYSTPPQSSVSPGPDQRKGMQVYRLRI